MGFEQGRRGSKIWEDTIELDEMIENFPFHTTGKNEREFEIGFSTSMLANSRHYNGKVITQNDKENTVKSVYCFGKSHRPDMTIDNDSIAVEIKFISYEGLKQAIGQGYFYRLRYKFVFLILVISEERKKLYEAISLGKEKDLEDILTTLTDLNIFTYFVPAFIANPGIKKCIKFYG